MRRARQRRTVVTLVASVAAHAGVLGIVALQSPQLRAPEEPGGPPVPVIPILIMPKAPPAVAGGPPRPVRLHLRAPRNAQAAPPPIPPLVTPAAQPKPAQPPSPNPAFQVREEPQLDRGVQAALRGRVGCANPEAAGLSRAERVACEELLGKGARDAPFLGLGMSRDKASALDAAAARKEADYKYKRGVMPSRPRQPGSQLEWDKYRGPPGQAEALGAKLGNDRPAATVPF